jgi:hypothetical protein
MAPQGRGSGVKAATSPHPSSWPVNYPALESLVGGTQYCEIKIRCQSEPAAFAE